MAKVKQNAVKAKASSGISDGERLPSNPNTGKLAQFFDSAPRKATFSDSPFIANHKDDSNVFLRILFKILGAVGNFFQKNLFIILAFAIPFVLMITVFAIMKCVPFGDKQILVTDLWHQYYPFLVDYQEKLKNGESLLWSWTQGGGTNYLALASYYLTSPLKLLTALIPCDWLMGFLTFSVAIRIGLAGAFFAIFLRYVYKRDGMSLVVFSTAFALAAFFMGYYWCEIWLDTAALTSLVVTGFVALMREGKYKLYVISLALSILANYYIGLFTCIFMVLCFIGYQFCTWKGYKWPTFKKFFIDLGKMAGFSVLSGVLTLFLMLPAFFGLQNTYATTSTFPTGYNINIGATDDLAGTIDALRQVIGNSMAFVEPTTTEGLPNISVGAITIAFTALFLASRKIKIREKIFALALLGFLMMSFIDRRLDYMWHGFHFTNMIPYRFSYLVSFVVVAMAFRAFTQLDYTNYIELGITTLLAACPILLSIGVQDNVKAIQATAIITLVVMGLLFLYRAKILVKPLLCIILVVAATAQGWGIGKLGVETTSVTSTYDYPRGGENTAKAIEYMKEHEEAIGTTELYRADFTSTQTLCDPSLNKINGISIFNSMTNKNITLFMENFGLMGWLSGNRYNYAESSPVSNLFMNLKYVIARDGNFNNTRYLKEVFTSTNVKLTENKSYIPMGFVTNSELLEWNGTDQEGTFNPFEKQNELFSLATGIDKDVYTQLEVVNQGHTDHAQFPVNKLDYGSYSFSCTDSTITPHLKWNYTAPKDGYYYAYVQISNEDRVAVWCNDTARTGSNSFYIKRPYIMSIGYFEKGDKISLYSDLEAGASGSAKVYVNLLNEKVYEKGVEILSESIMRTTKLSGTKMEGVINAKKDGLFYTSVPFEDGTTKDDTILGKIFGLESEGWTAYVDGKEVEITPVADAMVAFNIEKGEHKIQLKYVPKGFTKGTILAFAGLAVFVGICVLDFIRKKRRDVASVPNK